MAKVTQGARILTKRVNTPTLTPTLPHNDDHTTGWLETDIYESELFVNVTDKRIWVRTSGSTVDDAMTEFATLQSDGKIPIKYLPSSITGSLIYQGVWNAETNVPNINNLKSKGYYWVVTVSGTTDLGYDEAGTHLNNWKKTDWAIFDGSKWGIIVNSDDDVPLIASNVSYTNTNYPLLTNVQLALDNILYISPNVNMSVSIGGASVYNNLVELGSTLTTATLNWNVNKAMTQLLLTIPTHPTVSLTTPPLSGVYALHTYGQLPLSSTTYTLLGTDEKSNTNSSSVSIVFSNKVYWGISNNTTLTTSQDIFDLIPTGGSRISTSKVSPVTIPDGSNAYIYYCYPASYGTASFVIGGFSVGMILTTLSFTNSYGYGPITYNIYRNLVTTAAGSSVTINVS